MYVQKSYLSNFFNESRIPDFSICAFLAYFVQNKIFNLEAHVCECKLFYYTVCEWFIFIISYKTFLLNSEL